MRATKAVTFAAVSALALFLASCQEEHGIINSDGKASRPLRPEMVELLEKKSMRKDDPILIRVFKQESVLEIWKRDKTGRYALLKDYKICAWGGTIGPKIREGDKQSPEGFYTVTPARMNPNSQYHLSFDVGYPNAFDRAFGRTGAAIMVHGACTSAGCFAMTDGQVEEIYALAREAFAGGQPSIQVQSFPFRMTAQNMARNRNNPHAPFWRNLKEGYDHFEVTKLEPKVDVCDRRYVFNAVPKDPTSTVFNAVGACPRFEVPEHIAVAVAAKAKTDDVEAKTVVAALDEKDRKAAEEELAKRLEQSKPKSEGGSLMATIMRGGAEPSSTASVAAAGRTPVDVPVPRAAPGRTAPKPIETAAVAKPNEGMFSSMFSFGSKAEERSPAAAVVMPPAPPKPPVAPAPATLASAKPVPPPSAPSTAEAKPAAKPEQRSFWQRMNPFGG